MLRRLGGLTALALAVTLVASGCSNDETASVQQPVSGGQLIESLVRPSSEDPALADTVSERVLADHLYDGLTVWDPTTLSTRPSLAQRWEASADNKVWTFTLRDATAANGEPITAADVKASLERVARKSAGSPYADLLSAVVGFPEFSANDAVPALSGVTTPDAKTVRIELVQPAAELDKLLGNPAFSVVHRAGDGALVSTGPFMVASRPDANTIMLTRAPNSQAHLDSVMVKLFDDVNLAYEAFKRNETHWTPVSPERSGEAGDTFGTHLFRPSLRTSFVAFKTTNPKLADARFRQALVRAVDRRAVVEKMAAGNVRPMNGVVPDGVPGSQSGGCGSDCAHDPQAAQRLIKEVFGEAPPPALTLEFASGPPLNDAAVQQIVADLAKVGVAVAPRPTAAADYAGVTVRDDREMFQASWSAAYPSPDAFLPPLFTSSSTANVFELRIPDIDAKLVRAQTESNSAQRVATQQEIERDVMKQFPLIPLVQFATDSVAASDVRGLDPLPTGNFDISTVWLTPPGAP